MGLAHNVKKDIEAAKKVRLSWRGLLAWSVICLPVVMLLNHLGRLELALPVLGSFAILMLLLMLKRDLRSRVWFWTTILILIILHVYLVAFIPWPTQWFSPFVTGGIASADLCVMLAIFSVVERLIDGPGSKRSRSKIG